MFLSLATVVAAKWRNRDEARGGELGPLSQFGGFNHAHARESGTPAGRPSATAATATTARAGAVTAGT
jgi:hypothetical protein